MRSSILLAVLFVVSAVPTLAATIEIEMLSKVEYVITEAGLTAVICKPHQNMGMVALIVVSNDLSNAQQILDARLRGKGKDKIEALIEEAKATQP